MSYENTSATVIIDKAEVIEGVQTILDMFETLGQGNFYVYIDLIIMVSFKLIVCLIDV